MCTHVYMCMCVHVYMYMCICVYVYVPVYVLAYMTCVCVYVHSCMYVCMHVCLDVRICRGREKLKRQVMEIRLLRTFSIGFGFRPWQSHSTGVKSFTNYGVGTVVRCSAYFKGRQLQGLRF